MKFLSVAALAGALLVTFIAPVSAAETATTVYHVKGVVKAISAHSLTLEHDAVPELQWPPMTMPFALAKNRVLPAVNIDDPVDFDVSLVDGRYEITALTVRR
ncbi:copper-binding protein [Enterobacter sp. CC120223-11]|uniref:copper-binding protein n=1 Tax=Enterobacter sp. CC120223-11 TaxID=1378073 RepID=UPI000BCF23A2|nr:copper-binding protein [Enterobacter sp. CC120223-11]SNY78493.1 Cu(I)/Ag(I) efflux system protein CusF [Enterobacter sp. CC120223-11]